MRCCVPGCKNDSRHISKSQGITFHVFPNDQILRAAWLKVIGKADWEPKERSAVCSDHFIFDDLYITKSGLRKVKIGAVPIVVQDTTMFDYGDSSCLEVCRICLATDMELYPITKCKLQRAYENLTGLALSTEDHLPKKLCAECAQRLRNCQRLRNRSLRANSLMLEFVNNFNTLSVQNIKSIDRVSNNLNTSLSIKYYPSDYYDAYLEHSGLTVNEQTIESPTDDSKDVNEVFIDERIDVKDLDVKDLDVKDLSDKEEIDHCDKEIDNDYVTSDLDYSSDDDIPLETQRQKKEKTKKERVVRKKEMKIRTEPKVDRRRKPFLNDDLNETLFTVTDLTMEEQIADVLKRQESSNYKNAIYKCTECYKGFLDEDAYNGHMARHTDASGTNRCPVCKTHFRHPHALRKHVTAHHTQRFSCNRCPYVTTHRQTARLHERWHKGTKYSCPHCPEEFAKFTTYMGHIRIKHPSDFVCELCGYSFVSAKGIDLHKKLKHRLDDKQIPVDGPRCEPCGVRFVSGDALRRHLAHSARHPAPARPHARGQELVKGSQRRTGDKDAEDARKKYYQTRTRKAEGPIPCEQCGLQLEDSRAYHGHFRRVHPDKNRTNYPSMRAPCMCEVCGRMFQSYALLKDHTWVHTGERPFKCDSCGKAFRMKQRLVAHRRIHSQEKATYGCSLCGKQFSTHSNRQRHMFIHTGLKPFKCEMCGKGFKHSSEKRAHIGYVHLKKPWPKRTRGKRRTDNRQGLMPLHSPPPAAHEELPQWPCDPKIQDINSPMYYNLKI